MAPIAQSINNAIKEEAHVNFGELLQRGRNRHWQRLLEALWCHTACLGPGLFYLLGVHISIGSLHLLISSCNLLFLSHLIPVGLIRLLGGLCSGILCFFFISTVCVFRIFVVFLRLSFGSLWGGCVGSGWCLDRGRSFHLLISCLYHSLVVVLSDFREEDGELHN